MADKIKAILLKPLNGAEIGSEAEYDKADFDRLAARGAVKRAEAPKNKRAPEPMNKSAAKAGASRAKTGES